MRDRDIRCALKRRLNDLHRDEPDTLVLDELGLCQGTARVDIAVVNGSLNGFEIKSERDTLERLPGQQEVYSRALNQVTIVAGGSHIQKVILAVPDWWGVEHVEATDDGLVFLTLREPQNNPAIDAFAVAQLLWREEALDLLKEHGLERGMVSKPRRALWAKLATHLHTDELCDAVRLRLKARVNWRSDQPPASGDD
jgi:hypothetical protein